ncbi:hypothetical protein FB45DRAFT_380785 [Roridomyces roridus]|uniref:DUF1989 domain-containing protein n=1 Tax=Roridomyces roridus TaxID=1738132 RepID=A0AAD7FBD9_9AGAR|nr:hypothetical protein FB45DRAFT_380785 [Roridomyces roridus]
MITTIITISGRPKRANGRKLWRIMMVRVISFSVPVMSTPRSPPTPGTTYEIPPRSGVAFTLQKGQRLTIIDPKGCQVSDLLAFNQHDINEVISSGRTLDYASRIFLTTPDPLYSNRSNVLLRIVEDTVGTHDFLLTPCSKDRFRIIYGDKEPHRGCFGNLAAALEGYGVKEDQIPIAFNCFMNVPIDGTTGELKVLPPKSKAGDYITFVAEMDLVIGLTACSALQSNGGSFKPIHYRVDEGNL